MSRVNIEEDFGDTQTTCKYIVHGLYVYFKVKGKSKIVHNLCLDFLMENFPEIKTKIILSLKNVLGTRNAKCQSVLGEK